MRPSFVPVVAIAAIAAIAAIVAVACGTGKGAVAPAADEKLKPVAKLDAPPAAVHLPDAPGLNVEDLSARLRDAVALTSGLDVVDDLSVRAELAACTEAPCPDVVASKYREAAFIIASSTSKIGEVFLATVRVQRGADELIRVTAQASDARVAVEKAGREAGSKLHTKLVYEGVQERAAADAAADAVGTNGDER